MSSRKQVPAKKTPAKKMPAKKTPAKKMLAKKTPARKMPARQAGRSATPKASPLRGLPVLQWVRSNASAWQAGVIANLIELVSDAVPKATCAIKGSRPVFDLNGPMAFIRLTKEHVMFGFWRGAELSDPAGLLDGAERTKHLQIGDDEAFDRTRVVGFVREAASLNHKLGDPTKR